MNCDTHKEWIALSLYGELSGEEAASLEAHLRGCAACREAREAYAGTVALLRRATQKAPSRRIAWPGKASLLGGWAAAAAAIVVASVAFLSMRDHPRPVVSLPPSLPKAASDGSRLDAIEARGDRTLTVADEDWLCTVASGGDAAGAIRAVGLLGRRGTPRVERPLRAALARPATRAAAFGALAAIGRLDAMRDAVPALADPILRRAASDLLVERGTAEAFSAVFATAVGGDRGCLAACRAFRPEVSLPVLRAALADPAVRAAAVDLLMTADGDAFREVLVEAARADASVREAALARAAREASDAKPARFLALAIGDEALSPHAAQALCEVPVRALRPALAAMLRECGDAASRPAGCASVVAFLATRSSEAAARDLLVEALDLPEVRAAAGRALLAKGDARAVDALLRGGTEADRQALFALAEDARRRELARSLATPSLRAAVLRALGPGDGALLRQVIGFLDVERLRREAVAALGRIGSREAIPFLIPYVARTDEGREVHKTLVSLACQDAGQDRCDWQAWWRSRTN